MKQRAESRRTASTLETTCFACVRHSLIRDYADRLTKTFSGYASARAAVQISEYRARAKEVDGAAKGRQQWGRRQQAACEWLVAEVHQRAVELSSSQLDALKDQASIMSDSTTVQLYSRCFRIEG